MTANVAPDSSAVRTALWRALHVQIDAPPHLIEDEADRPGLEGAARGAQASGTPGISFYVPDEIVTVAREAGFADVRYVPTDELADRCLAGRTDGLRAASGEGILLARR